MIRTHRRTILRLLIVALTAVFAAVALVVNQGEAGALIEPIVGEPSPQDYVATRQITITDEGATEAEKERARINTPPVLVADEAVDFEVGRAIRQFFAEIDANADPILPPEPPLPEDPITPETTTSTAPPGEGEETTTTSSTTTTSTTTTLPPPPPIEDQLAAITDSYPALKDDTRLTLVQIVNDDFARVEAGELPLFNIVRDEALEAAVNRLDDGIRAGDLASVRNDIIANPPTVFQLGTLPVEEQAAAQAAIADVVAFFLQPNLREDEAATAIAQEEAAALVPDVTETYRANEKIVGQNELVTLTQLQAITELGLIVPVTAGPDRAALAAVGALIILLLAFFLWRVAPAQWALPKHAALFGLLVVGAAAASRIPALFPADRPEFGYFIPAAMFGYLVAILFDSRAAVLMAVAAATFTALSTGDLALTVYVAGAVLAPVLFVSGASSTRQLRTAVLYSAVVLVPYTYAIAWFFDGSEMAWKAAGVAFLGAVGSGIVALGILGPLENAFRVTTTLTLLDLTDRNHPALRTIEEEAPGTFNHSIMVGTLAGKAARAIGANPLLAQAAAYYHDLGKTSNPQYFIENQFGVSNPHDQLPPEESAAIIRAHVTAGLKLARQYRIPEDVAQGIRMHHGTGVMRFFYHKALAQDSDVDPALFRHAGEKPKGKEMAILMLSDAVEGAARALVQSEDPTIAGMQKVVDSVVDEKVEDGQLDESALTFGELSRVKAALVDALVGYYHARIPYPGFPGSAAVPPA